MNIQFPEDSSKQSVISIEYSYYHVPEFGDPYQAQREKIIRITYNQGGSYNASFSNAGTRQSADITQVNEKQVRAYIAQKITAIRRDSDVYAKTVKVCQIA